MSWLGIFGRRIPEPQETQVGTTPVTHNVEGELRSLVLEQLLLGGISADFVDIEIRKVGQAAEGREAFMCMLRLPTWEPRSAVRLMLGLPLFQAKVRKAVVNGWLHDVCHFAGIWLHPSSQLEAPTTLSALRAMIVSLERDTTDVERSVWSAPIDLDETPTSGL